MPYALGVGSGPAAVSVRAPATALAVGGLVALLALIVFAGYPVSAVGVPGAGGSNLNPPTLAAVALAVAQVGVVRRWRCRWLRRPPLAAPSRWSTAPRCRSTCGTSRR